MAFLVPWLSSSATTCSFDDQPEEGGIEFINRRLLSTCA